MTLGIGRILGVGGNASRNTWSTCGTASGAIGAGATPLIFRTLLPTACEYHKEMMAKEDPPKYSCGRHHHHHYDRRSKKGLVNRNSELRTMPAIYIFLFEVVSLTPTIG
jgi:hypothetical protein